MELTASEEFVDACILAVSVETNGFQGDDQGSYTYVTFANQASMAMEVVATEKGVTLFLRGDAELRVMARAFQMLAKVTAPFLED